MQIANYHPFGLTFNSYQRENSLDQKYLYNGKARQDELQLGWYDYGARTYMPDVGRWGVTDPLADKYFDFSPYNYAANNPVVFIDPTGAYITIYCEEDGKKKEYRYESGTAYEGNSSFVANTVAQLDYLIANGADAVAELAGNQEFNWGIKYVSMEQLQKKEDRTLGDGITTMGLVGTNYAQTSYNDLVGFETNTGGHQSPSTTLCHEAGHARISMQYYQLAKKYVETGDEKYLTQMNSLMVEMNDNNSPGFLSNEEKYVNDTYETPWAIKMGEGVRTSDYGNRVYQTAGPFTSYPASTPGPVNSPLGIIPPSVWLRIYGSKQK